MIRPGGISAYQDIESLRGRKDPEAIRIAAKGMEALFAYELIKAMREASQESTKGLGIGVYTSLFDMELARMMAERGLGLQDMLLKGLNRQAQKSEKSKVSNQNAESTDLVSISAPNIEGQESEPRTTDSESRRLPVDGVVTSPFGMRIHPVYRDNRFHHGVDIAAPAGTEVYPIKDGKVIFSGEQSGYGNVVIIDHGDGFISKYAHNRVNLVKEGDMVKRNTVIARVGSTGKSTGPHLHFEVRYNGESINPTTLIAKR